MILFRDDAILRSSNSKSGKGVIPSIEHEDFEQEHASVLNLIFHHENVCEIGKVKFRDLKSLLVCTIILKMGPLHRVE